MQTITIAELSQRHEDYRAAVMLLRRNHTTVAERKEAIRVRDAFERDVRDGILDGLFELIAEGGL